MIDNQLQQHLYNTSALKTCLLETPLGTMMAIADDLALYLLEFTNRHRLSQQVEQVRIVTKAAITPGHTTITRSIEMELALYFKGQITTFKTPCHILGSSFQRAVWAILQGVPYGETRSYFEQALLLNKPSAVRAIANANAANKLAIIIPCHRIIRHNGSLGGYAGHSERKQWLLHHEQSMGSSEQH